MLNVTRVIDLSQPVSPATVPWPETTRFSAVVDGVWSDDHFYSRTLTMQEHTGTHLDAPAHYVEHGVTVERIPAEQLVRPAVVLDARERCGGDPDWRLARADVEDFEARDGVIPAGSAVLLCTGWDRHRADERRYIGEPGDLRFPGYGRDAVELLLERGVAGIGIDTLGVDYGATTTFPVHDLALHAGIWQLEGLVNLDQVPARGALLVVGAPPIVDASGVTARVLALIGLPTGGPLTRS